jgi:hypothetical protein
VCQPLFFERVATILDIAHRADVPVEAVLRVVNGDPVSETYAERVKGAMAELGGNPDEDMVETLRRLTGGSTEEEANVVPSSAERSVAAPVATLPPEPSSAPGADVTGQLRDDLLQSLERAAATLQTSVPGLQRVVYEALRVEVHPVAEHVSAVGLLVGELQQSLDGLRADVGRERQERLRDIEVLIDLVVTGWQTVDRRLGRVEKMLERMQRDPSRTRRSAF